MTSVNAQTQPKTVCIGAGGHAGVLLELAEILGTCAVVACVDERQSAWGSFVHAVEVVGDDSHLARLRQAGVTHFILGIGSSKDTAARTTAYLRAATKDAGFAVHGH